MTLILSFKKCIKMEIIKEKIEDNQIKILLNILSKIGEQKIKEMFDELSVDRTVNEIKKIIEANSQLKQTYDNLSAWIKNEKLKYIIQDMKKNYKNNGIIEIKDNKKEKEKISSKNFRQNIINAGLVDSIKDIFRSVYENISSSITSISNKIKKSFNRLFNKFISEKKQIEIKCDGINSISDEQIEQLKRDYETLKEIEQMDQLLLNLLKELN